MNQEYFEKISDAVKKTHEPIQAMAELTMKTLQSYSYIKPEEFSNIKKPEEFIEKQLEIAVANGHKALDYLQKSFQIIEQVMLSFAKETKEQIKKS